MEIDILEFLRQKSSILFSLGKRLKNDANGQNSRKEDDFT